MDEQMTMADAIQLIVQRYQVGRMEVTRWPSVIDDGDTNWMGTKGVQLMQWCVAVGEATSTNRNCYYGATLADALNQAIEGEKARAIDGVPPAENSSDGTSEV